MTLCPLKYSTVYFYRPIYPVSVSFPSAYKCILVFQLLVVFLVKDIISSLIHYYYYYYYY